MQRWEQVPDWVREAVERCLHDLQQPSVVELRLEWSTGAAGDYLMLWEPDGSGSGFSVFDAEAGAEFDVSLADFLQDQVFPESREAWGEARPACPGHQHPATPTVVDGDAWWVCPTAGTRLSVIGAYCHCEEKPAARRRARRPRGGTSR
jgi:hypothetical protein